MRYFVSITSFAIILMEKKELVALLCLSLCLAIVVWLFLAVPQVCLQFVIVAFTDHTHLLSKLRTILTDIFAIFDL